jgi:hypothetical protein
LRLGRRVTDLGFRILHSSEEADVPVLRRIMRFRGMFD